MKKVVFGIDLGGTKVIVAAFEVDSNSQNNLSYLSSKEYKFNEILTTPISSMEQDNPSTSSGNKSGGKSDLKKKARVIEEKIIEMIKYLIDEIPSTWPSPLRGEGKDEGEKAVGVNKLDDMNLVGIGIASAGFIENDKIVDATNIGVKNYPIKNILEKAFSVPVVLIKDSWAPVYATEIKEPTIIFSIGTGFGGVSCEENRELKIKSKTLRNFPTWIPMLYFNDDPGFACSFSKEDFYEACKLAEKLYPFWGKDFTEHFCKIPFVRGFRKNGNERSLENPPLIPPFLKGDEGGLLDGIYSKIYEKAKLLHKTTPSKLEFKIASFIARDAIKYMKPEEIFPDFYGSAIFPAILYEILETESNPPYIPPLLKGDKGESPPFSKGGYGGIMSPKELDDKLIEGDKTAIFCFTLQGIFIGKVIYYMQRERLEFGLPYAAAIYGTGSGYNEKNAKVMQEAIVASMKYNSEKAKSKKQKAKVSTEQGTKSKNLLQNSTVNSKPLTVNHSNHQTPITNHSAYAKASADRQLSIPIPYSLFPIPCADIPVLKSKFPQITLAAYGAGCKAYEKLIADGRL